MRRYRILAAAEILLALGLASPALGQSGQRPPVPADLFRKPAGPYAIGTRDYLWIDESRGEPLTKDPSDKRHLMVQVWYPADSVPGAELAPYIRNPEEFGEFTGFKPVLHVKTNAVADAPLAKAERRYPVLVYHHGGSWTRFSATFETEWLASHGYVVVSVDHTGFNKTALFPDGYRFLPDTLQFPTPTNNLRVDALASWEYLDQVFETWVADGRFVLDQLESLNRTPGNPFHRRLDHGHFSDLTLFFPRDTTQLEPRRAHEIVNVYTLAFFDRYLRGKNSELLQGPSSLYPEVTFLKR